MAMMPKAWHGLRGDCHNRIFDTVESSKLIHDLWTISDLSKALKDVDSMKTQSENLTNEYDRLLEEKDKLERRLAVFGDGDKKDD